MSTGYKKLGKYDVLDVIGRGGMGVIYKGVDPEIGRLVAIKMMTRGFAEDPELLQRFYREAQSAGQLQHTNIVTIHDLGVHDGNPYLVMEFLEGESLETAIKSHRPILLEDKLNVVIQICDGLGYAHKRQIIHRDIKPANIMLLKDGGVKIVDFGIARVGNQSLTRPGAIMGSIQYMPPEQLNGAGVDARSDIFSLGVLLYQLLTSTLPFEGKDTGDTILKIIHQPAPSLPQYVADCPAELDEIVQRALAKDPEQRYQATEDLAFDLGHVREQLKRERMTEYMQDAESALAQRKFSRAKEQLLQVLKLDRQNARANTLLREVQQEIQKQQRTEQAQGLRAEAERALARKELGDALAYLDQALKLDDSNADIAQLYATVRESKARADKVRDLAQRAEMAQDAGDLDEARRAVEEALLIDGTSTEVRFLHAAICREIAERNRQLHVQQFMGEARKHISLRRFTAALEVLKDARSIDPALPGIQELIDLAENGQQQETRRKDLERLTSTIEDALNRDDYQTAWAEAEEGLRKYPGDRGLTKLKAVADKQREASEKRKYIEVAISASRKLLEQQKAKEALRSLQEALEKYPTEFALQSMHALVNGTIERERAEQKKADVIQKAKDAIYRKRYAEAISILEAARQEKQSSDFDDLLQFAQDEAANCAKRQAIDAVVEKAQRLNSEEKYQEAIDLLEATLQKVSDEELEIILSDIRCHVEELNTKVQEAISAAGRLLRQDRYADAVKLLESKNAQYGKSPAFSVILAEARRKQQFMLTLSAVTEQVREAIFRSEPDRAQEILDRNREQLGGADEFRLLQREIALKRAEIANAALEMVTRDARVLLVVRSFDSAVRVMETVAALAPSADPELRERFESLLHAAQAGSAKQKEEREQEQARQAAALDPGLETVETEVGTPEALDLDDGTQVAEPGRLQEILGEVTLIAEHYRDDSKIQSAISDLKEKITLRMSVLREAELAEQHDQASCQVPTVRSGETTIRAGEGTPWPSATDVEPVDSQLTELATVEALIPAEPLAPADSSATAAPSLETAEASAILGQSESLEVPSVADLSPGAQQEELVGESTPELAAGTSPPPAATTGFSELPAQEKETEQQPIGDRNVPEIEVLERVEKLEPLLVAEPAVAEPRPADSPVAPTAPPRWTIGRRPPGSTASVPPRVIRPPLRQPSLWKNSPVLIWAAAVLFVVIGIAIYARKPHPTAPVQSPATTPAQPQKDPIEAQQQGALDEADKLQAADNLNGAQRKLQEVAALNGPLSTKIQARLAGIDAAMKDQSLRRLRRREEQLWQRATKETDDAKFEAAKQDLRQILTLGDGAQRKDDAQRYLDQEIPNRQKKSAPRCEALKERVQLGEVLNEEDRTFLKESCQ